MSEGKRYETTVHDKRTGQPVRGCDGDAVVEVERLRSGIEDYLLWEPGRAGHAEAHRRLAGLLSPDDSRN